MNRDVVDVEDGRHDANTAVRLKTDPAQESWFSVFPETVEDGVKQSDVHNQSEDINARRHDETNGGLCLYGNLWLRECTKRN